MPWFVKLGDTKVNCDDLPMEVYEAIRKDTGVSWYDLLDNPMRHSAAGPALGRAAAVHIKVPAPDPITPRVLVDIFEMAASDQPVMYDDGLPSSGGAPTTG